MPKSVSSKSLFNWHFYILRLGKRWKTKTHQYYSGSSETSDPSRGGAGTSGVVPGQVPLAADRLSSGTLDTARTELSILAGIDRQLSVDSYNDFPSLPVRHAKPTTFRFESENSRKADKSPVYCSPKPHQNSALLMRLATESPLSD